MSATRLWMWACVGACALAVAVMLLARSPAGNVAEVNGRYVERYKGISYEITRAAYDDHRASQWRNTASFVAAAAMLLAIAGLEFRRRYLLPDIGRPTRRPSAKPQDLGNVRARGSPRPHGTGPTHDADTPNGTSLEAP